MQPLEETIRQQFLPALTGRDSPSDMERELLALPSRHRDWWTNRQWRRNIPAHYKPQNHWLHLLHSKKVIPGSYSNPIRSEGQIELGSEKGAHNWLTALLIVAHGFARHKGAYWDALCLRYNWTPLDCFLHRTRPLMPLWWTHYMSTQWIVT